jgi:hypothetical protein
MPKNKSSPDPLDMQDGPTFIPMVEPLTEEERAKKPLIPQDLYDLLDYLEGYFGDDEGRFDSTDLWPWRNLTFARRNLNLMALRAALEKTGRGFPRSVGAHLHR